jgi:hypothetical protein
MSNNVKNIVSLAEDRVKEAVKNVDVAKALDSLIFSGGANKKHPVVVAGVTFLEAVDFAAACILYHKNVQVEPVVNSLSYYVVSSRGSVEAVGA